MRLGQRLDFGDLAEKPRCSKHNPPLCLYVQKTDDGWRYACPDANCATTAPFAAFVDKNAE
jgi:hypothetical protein